MIEGGVSAQGAEVFFHPVTRPPDIRAGENQEAAVRLKLKARGRHDRIEGPFGRKLPADASARQDRILPPGINSHAEDELEIRAVNPGAADNHRHVKSVSAEVVKVGPVK